MRLTCPNCSARYEVADSMVPPEGRDVQCSNCSTTWFQPGRRRGAAAPDREVTRRGAFGRDCGGRPPQPEHTGPRCTRPGEPAGGSRQPRRSARGDPDSGTPAAEAAEAEDQPRRRTLDPDLRSILEQEAEREAPLRRAEAEPVETQGRDAAWARSRGGGHRARCGPSLMRRAMPLTANRGTATGPMPGGARPFSRYRRDQFDPARYRRPVAGSDADASDIDTLDTIPRRRRGTRIGFLLALAMAAGAAALLCQCADVLQRRFRPWRPDCRDMSWRSTRRGSGLTTWRGASAHREAEGFALSRGASRSWAT
jgi:predicted Zn finger-like uncharacterized protein